MYRKVYLENKLEKKTVINSPENESCHTRTVKSISEELYKD